MQDLTPDQEWQLQCHENAMFKEAETQPEDHQPPDIPQRCPCCNSERKEYSNRGFKCGSHYPWPQEGEGLTLAREQSCYVLECEEKAGTIIALETSIEAEQKIRAIVENEFKAWKAIVFNACAHFECSPQQLPDKVGEMHENWLFLQDGYKEWKAIKNALAKLSLRLEKAIQEKREVSYWLPDHACSECVPGGEIVKPGFLCARHQAIALLNDSTYEGRVLRKEAQ